MPRDPKYHRNEIRRWSSCLPLMLLRRFFCARSRWPRALFQYTAPSSQRPTLGPDGTTVCVAAIRVTKPGGAEVPAHSAGRNRVLPLSPSVPLFQYTPVASSKMGTHAAERRPSTRRALFISQGAGTETGIRSWRLEVPVSVRQKSRCQCSGSRIAGSTPALGFLRRVPSRRLVPRPVGLEPFGVCTIRRAGRGRLSTLYTRRTVNDQCNGRRQTILSR